ncbi:MAG: glycoside hydrolase family 127 protein [Pseudobutyrivibrio sp.]|uniref:glycoside hydrolase family 127 protein n=1 Tax=Pseudobutyrivibrio sp. TaxID=2014367 RepID=UPI0025F79D5F|nr:beta-L-arabinofuranosidase domain-containing protein [Pseudobutyrivibrio sp.]MBE5904130.1 glycoside hydrolase family 127 protein [Pseudobutyrivibrio sp.]
MATKVQITSKFWTRYRQLVRTEMIPYQWKVLNDIAGITIEKERLNDEGIPSEKSHAIENFKIAAKRAKGTHYGWTFQDSDVYKWLEAVAYSLREKMDPQLNDKALEVIDLIADAQEDDGYLDTFYSILGIEHRYQSLAGSHELYCMGHFIEAAVAYFEATENEKVLTVAKKAADNVDANFGSEEGKIHGYDGHEEIEIGLLRLYHVTGEERYLNLAKYFLMERGKHPDFFREQAAKYNGPDALKGIEKSPDTYFQNHKPILEQDTAEGHAVRVVYMCTALADLAYSTGDKELYAACVRLWDDITKRRMYITGGIGSTVIGESFTLDYDLPNDTMYCETCAAIGLIFFAKQMLKIEAKAEYAEVMERALYNCALAGMALDGKHFFYVNPLQVDPKKSKKDPTKSHVKPVRPSWLGCACCPPNLARLIASLDDYVYTINGDSILINQYIASSTAIEDAGTIKVEQITDYPWDDSVSIRIENNCDHDKKIGVRIPGWADGYRLTVNGKEEDAILSEGYAYIDVARKSKVIIDLYLEVSIKRYYANTAVSEDVGKVAIGRGPFIYCLEGVDNGEYLNSISLPKDAKLTYKWTGDLLNGVGVIEGKAKRAASRDTSLYSTIRPDTSDVDIKFIPYYAWANRGENEMQVWVREWEA